MKYDLDSGVLAFKMTIIKESEMQLKTKHKSRLASLSTAAFPLSTPFHFLLLPSPPLHSSPVVQYIHVALIYSWSSRLKIAYDVIGSKAVHPSQMQLLKIGYFRHIMAQ
ncbi:hypothetical protein ACTXT7_007485 [Hymenolepis weldensis]